VPDDVTPDGQLVADALSFGLNEIQRALWAAAAFISYLPRDGGGPDECPCKEELEAIAASVDGLAESVDATQTTLAGNLAPLQTISDTLGGWSGKAGLLVDARASVVELEGLPALLQKFLDLGHETFKDAPPGTPGNSLVQILSNAMYGAAKDATVGPGEELHSSVVEDIYKVVLNGLMPGLTVGGVNLTSAIGAALKLIVGWASSASADLAEPVTKVLGESTSMPALGSMGPFGGLGKIMIDALADMMTMKKAVPDNALGNCARAYGYATGLGVVAHSISALASMGVGPVLGPNMQGLAAFIGDLAGFKQLGQIVAGTFYQAWCATPLLNLQMQAARPNVPGPDEVLRWWTKGYFGGRSDETFVHPVPFDWHTCLEYYGRDDGWIERAERDAWRDISQGEIVDRLNIEDVRDDWIWAQLQDLQYRPEDIPVIIRTLRNRPLQPHKLAYLSGLQRLRSEGILGEGEFRAASLGKGFPEAIVDAALQTANLGLRSTLVADTVTATKAQYSRGQISDGEFEATIDALFADRTAAQMTVVLGRMMRYHKVWILTPSEQAKAALPTYRQALDKGLITGPEYMGKLLTAGVAGDVAGLLVQLGTMARDDAVLAQFKSYGLPAYRDEVVHGMLSPAAYGALLARHNFPSEYLGIEVRYAEALLLRRQEADVAAKILPPFRAAYVAGLIGEGALDPAFAAAGYTPAQIAAQHEILDYQREQTENRRQGKASREEKARVSAVRFQQEKENKDAERARVAAEKKAAADEAKRQKGAAAACKALAAAIKALLAIKEPADPDAVDALLYRMWDAYAAAGALAPDQVWYAAQAVSDIARETSPPDMEALNAAVDNLQAQLSTLAG